MASGTRRPAQTYQIKVTLTDLQPPIWRRIQVRSDTTLAELHRILQCTLGWTDTHLHQFIIRGEHYGVPDEVNPGARQRRDERRYRLDDVAAGVDDERWSEKRPMGFGEKASTPFGASAIKTDSGRDSAPERTSPQARRHQL